MKLDKERRRLDILLVLLLILLVVFSLYSALKIMSLEVEVTSIQNEKNSQAQQLASLQKEVAALNYELRSVLYPTNSSTDFLLSGACVSIGPQCGGYVYLITLDNNGTVEVPLGYSIFLGFKDSSRLTFFDFNTTLSQGLPPGGAVILSATSWPSGTDAASKMSTGDNVSITVKVGSFQASLEAHVQSCTPLTTTSVNGSQTRTVTTETCN